MVTGIKRHSFSLGKEHGSVEVTALRCSNTSYRITITPGVGIASGFVGTITERSGKWSHDNSLLLSIFIDQILGYMFAGSKIRIDSVTVYMESTTNQAHVAGLRMETYDPTDGSFVGVYNSTITIGSGSTGYDNGPYTIGYVMADDLRHNLLVDVYVDSGDAGGTLTVHAIDINFSTVAAGVNEDGAGAQSGLGDIGLFPTGPEGGLGD